MSLSHTTSMLSDQLIKRENSESFTMFYSVMNLMLSLLQLLLCKLHKSLLRKLCKLRNSSQLSQSCHTKLDCWLIHSKTIFSQSASSSCLDLESDCQTSSIFMSCSHKCCLFNAHLFFLILYKLYSISYILLSLRTMTFFQKRHCLSSKL